MSIEATFLYSSAKLLRHPDTEAPPKVATPWEIQDKTGRKGRLQGAG
ncbi:MAG: hypothetical protein O8C61_11640 [Candidatus Methanoperedens sp.]|nr:hypothetical protein [Candidatus Methanoperedens sp.]